MNASAILPSSGSALDPQTIALALLSSPPPPPIAMFPATTAATAGPPLSLASVGQAALQVAPSDALTSPTLQDAPFVTDSIATQLTLGVAPSPGHAVSVISAMPDVPVIATTAATLAATIQPAPVPEPTALALLATVGVALAARALLRRRRACRVVLG